jgi:L,D-peptidoglycan transpeptidase YkuD (ErfK/YbiS/YcfS/YnhG family)
MVVLPVLLPLLAVVLAAPPATARVPSPVPADARQLVLSVSADWDATTARIVRFERAAAGAPWRALDPATLGSLGRTGLAWGAGLHPPGLAGPQKREGDGKGPAGVFDLRLATGYAPAPPAGTRLRYRPATQTLRCVDDPRSKFYNQLVDEAGVTKDWTSAEDMRRPDDLYRLVVWVGHNDAPVAKGAGSCIFLHLRGSPTSVTAGCTAFDDADITHLLVWLDPAKRPVLVQLPAEALRKWSAVWGLPPLPDGGPQGSAVAGRSVAAER